MKRTLTPKLLYPIALLPIVLACNLASVVKKAVDKAQQPTQLTSSDGTTQLTLPGGWREEKEMNDSAILQAASRFQEMYIIVIKEHKQDYHEGATLQEFTELSRTSLMTTVKEPQATEPIAAPIGAYSAMEYQLAGSVDKIKVKYICATVETPNHYYQVLTWTLPSRFAKNEATLRQVMQSFKELKD